MLTPEVQNYITQSRAAGITDDQIRQNLVAKGWKQQDVESFFRTTTFSISRVIFFLAVIPLVVLVVIFISTGGGGQYGLVPVIIYSVFILLPIIIFTSVSQTIEKKTKGNRALVQIIIGLIFIAIISFIFVLKKEAHKKEIKDECQRVPSSRTCLQGY